MPVIYSDYKIKCPFYGSTRGKRIVCSSGYSVEFTTQEQMEKWKAANCRRFKGYGCRARKKLTKQEENKAK